MCSSDLIVRDVCLETDDCGALYKGRNPSCRGNVIRYNFWHHIGPAGGHGNAAVYFDDGDGGDRVIGNVFVRCGNFDTGSFGAVFSHGGHDNRAENNVFIDCRRALGSAPWTDDRWRAALQSNRGEGWNWQDKLLRQVDITAPTYTARYPELAGFMDPPPGRPRQNQATRNVFVRCGSAFSGNWQVATNENWITDSDPGFVAAEHGNFAFKPGAAVFERLPGFQPIPFDRMGLYADELRPKPPKEDWPAR